MIKKIIKRIKQFFCKCKTVQNNICQNCGAFVKA